MKFCSKFLAHTPFPFHSPSPSQQLDRLNPTHSALKKAAAGSILPLLLCAAGAHSADFRGIGMLDDKASSWANDVSNNASTIDDATVVGRSFNSAPDGRAFYWTKTGGIVNLGVLSNGASNGAAVNSDGSSIVGNSGGRAFRWTQSDGMVELVRLVTSGTANAKGVSADGSVVVGQTQRSFSGGTRFDAIRWTTPSNPTSLGFLPGVGAGDFFADATGVSADGSIVVGDSRASDGQQAFVWTDGVMVGLGGLSTSGSPTSFANAVSSDGTFVVGGSFSDQGPEAFLWSQANGMIGLGDLPGGNYSSEANDVSADGSIVVGRSEGNSATGQSAAVIWDSANGMRDLKTLLQGEGLNLGGWQLVEATGVSDDGTVIVGRGINTANQEEGWVAQIDFVDSDGDGVPDSTDACPLDPLNDADGDGVCGDVDSCPYGDETDSDGDGLADACDVCPADAANDADGDGMCEAVDNCPLMDNAAQLDNDDDGQGDACDNDDDNDSHPDATDNCPLQANDQTDSDGDGAGDACDTDADGDDVVDAEDACPLSPTGEVVNASGCAVADLCPCTHSDSGKKWKNHGAYVKCVAHTTNDFVEAGLLTQAEKDAIQSAAGASSCGKKNKK
ncbi:MAG: thrombospondin type 3 repeat-containing protein [Pseudomonadales bacterium]